MKPTIRFMKQTFQRFNKEYFQSSLPTPTFKLSRSKRFMGYCSRKQRTNACGTIDNEYIIGCSICFDSPLEEHENTMLHEMCHLWVYFYHPDTTEPSHGPIWRSIARSVTVASNYKYLINPSGPNHPSSYIFSMIEPTPIPIRKSARLHTTKPVTPEPSFTHTLLRTLFLLMLLFLFL